MWIEREFKIHEFFPPKKLQWLEGELIIEDMYIEREYVCVCVCLCECVCVSVWVCVCTCARILTDDIDMITHHLSGDIATTEDVIGC